MWSIGVCGEGSRTVASGSGDAAGSGVVGLRCGWSGESSMASIKCWGMVETNDPGLASATSRASILENDGVAIGVTSDRD